MRTRVTGAALAVLLAFAAVAGSAAVASAWMPGPKPKAIVLKASPGTSSHGQPVKLALALTPKGGGQPQGGTVTFRTGETVLGTATATKRITTITTTALPVGEPTVTATYSGDPRVAAATSNSVVVVVGPARTTTTLTSAGPVEPGQRAELKATVRRGAARLDGSVAFGTGDTLLGIVPLNSNGVATWRPVLAEGSHEITATYLGYGTDGQSTSRPVTQIVAPAEATVDQDNGSDATGSTYVGDDPIAQTFTAGRTGLLERVQVSLNDGGIAMDVSIRATLDGVPTDVLATGSFTTVGGTNDIVLAEPVPVTSGTTYAVTFNTNSSDYVGFATNDGTYAGGQLFYENAWDVEVGLEAADLIFTTWVR